MAFKPRILIVEDDDELRSLLSMTMKHAGFETAEAANGLEALPQVENFKPDVIALDLMMPKLDGRGVLKALAQRDLKVAVVIVTAYWEPADEADLRQDPRVLDILKKPLRYTSVAREILGLLSKHKILPDSAFQDLL